MINNGFEIIYWKMGRETQDEARHEIEHWFGKDEKLWDYERSDEMIMFPKN